MVRVRGCAGGPIKLGRVVGAVGWAEAVLTRYLVRGGLLWACWMAWTTRGVDVVGDKMRCAVDASREEWLSERG